MPVEQGESDRNDLDRVSQAPLGGSGGIGQSSGAGDVNQKKQTQNQNRPYDRKERMAKPLQPLGLAPQRVLGRPMGLRDQDSNRFRRLARPQNERVHDDIGCGPIARDAVSQPRFDVVQHRVGHREYLGGGMHRARPRRQFYCGKLVPDFRDLDLDSGDFRVGRVG